MRSYKEWVSIGFLCGSIVFLHFSLTTTGMLAVLTLSMMLISEVAVLTRWAYATRTLSSHIVPEFCTGHAARGILLGASIPILMITVPLLILRTNIGEVVMLFLQDDIHNGLPGPSYPT